MSKVVDVLLVKLGEADKLLHILLLRWAGPFLDSLDETGIGMDAILGNNMAEELSLFLHKRALAQFSIEAVLAEEGEDTANVGEMVSLGLGVNKDVVKVDNNPLV